MPQNFLHPLANFFEILGGEGFRGVKVVVEARLCPWADGDLNVLEQTLHRHGHNVATTVADAQQLIALAGAGQVQGGRAG